MKVITPFDINDSVMSNNIPEPDVALGEVEWERRFAPEDLEQIFNSRALPRNIAAGENVVYIASDGIAEYEIDTGSVVVRHSTTGFSGSTVRSGIDGLYLTVSPLDKIRKYNVDDKTLIEIGDFTDACDLLVSGNDSYVYGFNRQVSGVTRINSDYDQVDSIANTEGFISANLGETAYDGDIYITTPDAGGSSIRKLNPSSESLTLVASSIPAATMSARSDDGRFIYFIGSNSITAVNVASSSYQSVFIENIGFNRFRSCEYSAGYIYLFSSDGDFQETVFVINAETFKTEIISTNFDNYGFAGAVNYNGVIYTTYTTTLFPEPEGETRLSKVEKAYDSGDEVIKTSTHKLYKAATITKDDPEVGVDKIPPTWVEVSATNKYRAFDYVISSQSEFDETLQYELTPEKVTSTISLFGLNNIEDVTITVREDSSSGAVIYTSTKNLSMPSPFEDQLSNDSLYIDKVLFDDLPLYATPYILVEFSAVNPASNIFVGDIVIGNSRTIGTATYQSSTSRTSYDTVDVDTFGNEKITNRPSAEYTTFELVVEPEYANYVEQILKDSLNKPRVYVGDLAADEKMFTFGYYERNPIIYSAPTQYETALKVRGLV